MAGVTVSSELCGKKGFRDGSYLNCHASVQQLSSSRVGDRDRVLLRRGIIRLSARLAAFVEESMGLAGHGLTW